MGTGTEVSFSELAVAGARRLFDQEDGEASLLKSIALALRLDPTRNAIRLDRPGIGNFWLRGFFAGFEVRVLFELSDPVVVWSISRTSSGR